MRTEPSFSADPDDHLHVGSDNFNSAIDSESQLLPDYRQRYGLSTDPFTDDPHFPFYQGAQRRQILEQLLHLCQFSNNLLLVTGEYGVGKTRMAQALIDSLDDADDICFVEGQITSDTSSLFSEVLSQFELINKAEFTEFCLRKSDQDGLVVLIIDNAHHLTDEVIADVINLLEENFESRLHLVMFAEPHLLERLNSINAPDIVLTDFFLEKFSLPEAVDYLNFRMEMADYLGPEIFLEAKVEPWWRQSQGQLIVLHEHAQEKLLATVSDSRRDKGQKPNMLVPHIVATSVLIGVLFVGYLYVGGDSEESAISQTTESIPIGVQQESVTNLPQSSAQSSSLQTPTPDAAALALAEKSLGDSNAISSATTSIPSETTQLEIKQSVVPLVETNNDFHSQAVQQQNKTAINSVAKEVKAIASTSIPAKPIVKVKSENSTTSKASTYSSQEKTILSWGESEFTLQIVGLSSEKSALEFIAAQSNKKDLLLFRSLRQGKDWYVVVAGHYPNVATARQAAKSLPESQLKATPWPRDLKAIHQEITQRTVK